MEKKVEEGRTHVVAAPASHALFAIPEDGDLDEAAEAAGEVAQTFTEEENAAVRRKLDRRVSSHDLSSLLYMPADARIVSDLASTCYNLRFSVPGQELRVPEPSNGLEIVPELTSCFPVSNQLRLGRRRVPDHGRALHCHRRGFLRWVLHRRDTSDDHLAAVPNRPVVRCSARCAVRLASRELTADVRSLGINVLLWAACLTLHAASGAFGPFLAFRILLGVFESVVSPIMIALVASFYRKEEQAKRIAAFYCCNGITAIVGGIIAWGVSHIDSRESGREPWRIVSLCTPLF